MTDDAITGMMAEVLAIMTVLGGFFVLSFAVILLMSSQAKKPRDRDSHMIWRAAILGLVSLSSLGSLSKLAMADKAPKVSTWPGGDA